MAPKDKFKSGTEYKISLEKFMQRKETPNNWISFNIKTKVTIPCGESYQYKKYYCKRTTRKINILWNENN